MSIYYVKNDGSDGQSGLSDSSAWQTIAKVNTVSFVPGDKILFKRGNTWHMSGGYVLVDSSGTQDNHILFGAYGSGEKPIFDGLTSVPGWDTSSNWTNPSTNIWRYSVANNGVYRLWLSSSEGKRSPDASVSITLNWYFGSNVLSVYSTNNPALNFSNIEWIGYDYGIRSETTGADFITIENLDIRGCYYSISLRGTTDWLIQDCNIGLNGNTGIVAIGSSGTRGSVNNLTVRNCVLDTNDKNIDDFSFNNTYEGISQVNGCDNWDIYDNKFYGWSHGALALYEQTEGYVMTNVRFHDNFITTKDIDYGYAYVYNAKPNLGACYGNKVYNNYIYNTGTTAIQLNGDGIEIYNNVIDTVRKPSYETTASGLTMQSYSGKCCDISIYNNIFTNCQYTGISILYSLRETKRNTIINNIFYDNGTYDFRYEYSGDNGLSIGTNNIKNNLFFKSGISDRIYYEKMSSSGAKTMTVDEFNAMDGSTTGMYAGEVADNISNNVSGAPQFKNASTNYLLKDYRLNSDSSALHVGADVSLLYDALGLSYSNPPSMGAYEYFDVSIFFVKNDGNNGANGLSDASAWQTITKVNTSVINPGNFVLFKRGNTWVIDDSIYDSDLLYINDYSGSTNLPITYGAYGTGNQPIITGRHAVDGWGVSSNWINSSTNIWHMHTYMISNVYANQSPPRGRLWINDVAVQKAQSLTVPDTSTPWTHDGQTLYIYSTTNPALTYLNIECVGVAVSTAIVTKDYITLKDLDLRGSCHTLQILGNHCIVENCSIGWDCGGSGLYAIGKGRATGNVDDVIIRNNTFDTNDYLVDTYTLNNTENGINIWNGCSNWDIHHNVFKNWSHADYGPDQTDASYLFINLKFHHNYCSGSDVDYGKGFNFNTVSNGNNTGNEIYNNIFYNYKTGLQMSCDLVKFYNNIVDTVRGSSGLSITGYTGVELYNNEIYNNVFTNCYSYGLKLDYGSGIQQDNIINNNIFYNNNQVVGTYAGYQLYLDNEAQLLNNTYKNNLFYKGAVVDLIYYGHNHSNYPHTVEEFNAENGTEGDVISGNIRGLPLFVDASLFNFHLSIDSSAIHAGTYVGLVTDFDGSLWNNPPSIGAYEYSYDVNSSIYYIDPSGSDSSGNGTISYPWKTLNKACASTLTSGWTIHVNAGTYDVSTRCYLSTGVNLEGDGSTSIIKSSISTQYYSTLNLNSASEGTSGNQTISYLKFDGSAATAYSAIEINARSNVQIHDCYFADFFHSGVTFNGAASLISVAPTIWATGNKFYNNVLTNCADFEAGGDGWGELQIGGQDGIDIYDNYMSSVGRALRRNGYNIKFYSAGYNKAFKIHGNTLIMATDATSDPFYDFSIENWHTLGGAEIYNNTMTGGIDIGGGITMICLIKGAYDYGVWIYDNSIGPDTMVSGRTGVYLERNTEYAIIERNNFRNLYNGITLTPGANETARYHTIDSNIFNNIGYYGIRYMYGVDSSAYAHHLNFYNNVFYVGAAGGLVGIGIPTVGVTNDINIKNNIIQGATYSAILGNGTYGETLDNLNIQNNIFYGNAYSNVPRWDAGLTPTNYTNSGNLTVIPNFISASTNFRLQSDSSAIHAGLYVGLTYDFDGSLWNNPPSIGAYEYSYSPDSSVSAPFYMFTDSTGIRLVYNGMYLTW